MLKQETLAANVNLCFNFVKIKCVNCSAFIFCSFTVPNCGPVVVKKEQPKAFILI